MDKVIVGITSKNRVTVLPKAIESALEQTYPNLKVVVFDDASTDGTHLLQEKYPQVEWIISDVPKGYMYARNLFLHLDKEAKYFCSLDDDAWFLSKDTLTRVIKFLDANPKVGAVALDILSPDDASVEVNINPPIEYTETSTYIGCGHLLNIEHALSAGGYLQSPGFYGSEEKDLCIRLMDKSLLIILARGAFVWHDKTNISRDLRKQHQSGVCNDLVFTYRRAPWYLLIQVLCYKCISHLRFAFFNRKENLVKPCLLGFKDFFNFLKIPNKQRMAVSYAAYSKFLRLQK